MVPLRVSAPGLLSLTGISARIFTCVAFVHMVLANTIAYFINFDVTQICSWSVCLLCCVHCLYVYTFGNLGAVICLISDFEQIV